jgi:AcrR family transcriptional regulator
VSSLLRSATHRGEVPQRIIHAAADLFSTHGFRGTRVREVVRRAQVNLAAVNYYFGGKDALYAATIAELSATRTVLRPRDDFDADPVDLLQQHISIMLKRALENGQSAKLSRILAHESMEPTRYFEDAILTATGPEFERLVQIIGRIAVRPLSKADSVTLAVSIMGQCYFYLFARPAVEVLSRGLVPGGLESLALTLTRFSVGAIRSGTAHKP